MDISNMLGDASGVDPSKLTTAIAELVQQKGGVDGIVTSLRDGGLGGAVDSWISTGDNQPVDPQKLGAALGPDTTNQLAAKTGLSVQALLPMLAAMLPMIIDHLTPGGQLPAGGGTGSTDDIGSVIGGILGGGAGGLGGLGGLAGGLGGMFGGGWESGNQNG